MARWRRLFVFDAPAPEPFIHFLGSRVQASGLKFVLRLERVPVRRLALLRAIDALLNGFARDPMRGTSTSFGQALNPSFQLIIELDGYCRHHDTSFASKN